MRKKSAAVLSIVIVVLLVLAACSSQTVETDSGTNSKPASQSNNNKQEATEPEVTGSDEPAEITIWTGHSAVEKLEKMVGLDILQEKFPNYTFNFLTSRGGLTLEEYLMQNTAIDIYVESIGYIAEDFERGLNYDMTPLIEKHDVDLSGLDQVAMDYIRTASEGELWALPLYSDTLVLYYNKELFDKFGVDYPEDGMTWDELSSLAERMTRNEDDVQYFGFTIEWLPHTFNMNQLSLALVDSETNSSNLTKDPGWTEFFQTTYLNMLRGSEINTFIETNNRFPNRQDFINQNVAMMTGLATYTNEIAEFYEDLIDWDMVSLPTFQSHPNAGPQVYPAYVGIAQTSQNKDAAMAVLKHLVSEDFQNFVSQYTGGIPVLEQSKDTFVQNSQSTGKNLEAVYYHPSAQISTKTKFDNYVSNRVRVLIPNVVAGTMDLNTALRTASEEANQDISAQLAESK